jgi:RNA polymerase sigma-70 factor (ECF subfamily)
MLGDAGAAEDVVQETLLAAFAGTGSFRGESSIGTWLVSILVKQTARHRRRESLRRHASFDKTAPPAGRPHASTSDAKIDVNWAIGELDERFRDVIVLRELDGLSYDEIAKALALPRGTVESRLHRARAALRKKLAAYGK